MSSYKTVYQEVEVEVDLDEWTTEELLEELAARDSEGTYRGEEDALYRIWLKRRQGQDYQRELDDLIYHKIGKIV